MFKLRKLIIPLLFVLIHSTQCLEITQSKLRDGQIMLEYPQATGAKYRWFLDRVVNLPNGKPLPDFFYDFMTAILSSKDECAPTRRDLIELDSAMQLIGVNKDELSLLTTAMIDGFKTQTKPSDLSGAQTDLYNKIQTGMSNIPPTIDKATIFTQMETEVAKRKQDVNIDPNLIPKDQITIPNPTIPGTTPVTTPTPNVPPPEKITISQQDDQTTKPVFSSSSSSSTTTTSTPITGNKNNLDNIKIQSEKLAMNLNNKVDIPKAIEQVAPSVIKEVSKRLEFLQQSLSDQDITRIRSKVVFDGSTTNQFKVANFVDGFAYYFRLELTVDDQVQNITHTYVHTDLDFDTIKEIPNFSINLNNLCQRQFDKLQLQLDLSADPIMAPLKDQIQSMNVEVAPFFQFANEDVCVESLGWRLKHKKTFQAGDNPLSQTITFNQIPFTPQDTLQTYVQVTYTLKNSTQLIGMTVFTVKGMVLKAGQLLSQLKSSDQLKVLAFLVSIKETTGTSIDLDKIDLDDLLIIADQLAKLTNIQDLSTSEPGLALVQGVLKKCNASFSWMVQMLQSQQKNQKKELDHCSQNKNGCGNKGMCQKKPNSEDYFCACQQGYAGNSCQFLEAEYQAMLSGQNKLLERLSKLTEGSSVSTLARITQLANQPVIDKTSAEELQKLIVNCIKQVATIEEVNELIYGVEKLKAAYKDMTLTDKERQEHLGNLGKIVEDIVKKSAQLLYTFTGESIVFSQLQIAGQITKLDQSSTQVNLQLNKTIMNPDSQLFYPSPSAQLSGLDKAQLQAAKAVVFQIQQCEFQGMKECLGPILRIAFVDNNGLDVVPVKGDGVLFKFTLPVTTNGTNISDPDICAWIDEATNELKVDGCKSNGVQDGLLHCECTHLTRFISSQSAAIQAINGQNTSVTNNSSKGDVPTSSFEFLLMGISLILILLSC